VAEAAAVLAPRPAAARRRRALLSAALLVLLVAGGGSELYLRSTLHPPPNPSRHMFARPPLVRLRVTIDRPIAGLPQRSVLVTTNALGVRGDELDLRDASVFKLLTLGDSVTECLLLSDAEAWPRRLQDELAARSGRKLWVGNAAGSGELALDYVAHMRALVPEFGADLVLVMPGGYELQAAVEEKLLPMDLTDARSLAAYSQKLYGAQNARAKQTFEELAPSYLGFALEAYFHPDELRMRPFYERMRARRAAHPKLHELPGFEDALDVYKANLKALIASWRALPRKPGLVFLTRPFMWKNAMSAEEERTLWGGYTCMDCPDPEYYAQDALAGGLSRFNQLLLDTCRSEAVTCLDLERLIPKDLRHFYDDAHLQPTGARVVAREIANFLFSQHLVN
jgi:hypothetical protein